MRFKSADDGISTAVVLCLQSGKARGQTPQQRGAYLLRVDLQLMVFFYPRRAENRTFRPPVTQKQKNILNFKKG